MGSPPEGWESPGNSGAMRFDVRDVGGVFHTTAPESVGSLYLDMHGVHRCHESSSLPARPRRATKRVDLSFMREGHTPGSHRHALCGA